jgi:hypothetical protein
MKMGRGLDIMNYLLISHLELECGVYLFMDIMCH